MRTVRLLAAGMVRGSMRVMLMLALTVCAALSLVTPAGASTTLARDVVMMEYKKALGGSVKISNDSGNTNRLVLAGPYVFDIWEAKVGTTGELITFSDPGPIDTMLVMFCDSAAYNLLRTFPYVELSGPDVLAGNGRLFADVPFPAPVALDTYKLMSWAYNWALIENTQAAFAAAQIYIWELESNAVLGEPFDLETGTFRIPGAPTRNALMNFGEPVGVDFLLNNADLSLIASVNSPVARVGSCAGLDSCAGAGYSDSLRTGSTNEFTTQYFNITNSSQEFLWEPITSVPEGGATEVLALGVLLLLAVAYFGPHTSTRR